jgi:DNA-binding NarL/FixJ family response regulator
MITVLHIEDDPLWGMAVASICAEWPEFRHIGTEASGVKGIERCRKSHPGIVVLDLRLPDLDGFTVLEAISELDSRPQILLLTCKADDYTLFRANCEGVAGLVWKTYNFRINLYAALHAIMDGRKYFSPEVQAAVRRFHSASDAFHKILSNSEQRLMCLLAKGYADDKIAIEVGLSAATIHSHRRNIMRKLDLHSTQDLIQWGQYKGFSCSQQPAPTCECINNSDKSRFIRNSARTNHRFKLSKSHIDELARLWHLISNDM